MAQENRRLASLSSLLALALAFAGCAVSGDTAEDVDDGDPPPAVAKDDHDQDPATPDVDIAADPPDVVAPLRETTVGTAFGPMAMKYRVVDGDAIAEGDIILPSTETQSGIIVGRHWPRAKVPYVLDVNLPGPERVLQA